MTVGNLLRIRLSRFDISHIFVPAAVLFIALIFLARGDGAVQFQIGLAAVFLYLAISFLHHYLTKSLTLEVGIEYILIASLAIILLRSALV